MHISETFHARFFALFWLVVHALTGTTSNENGQRRFAPRPSPLAPISRLGILVSAGLVLFTLFGSRGSFLLNLGLVYWSEAVLTDGSFGTAISFMESAGLLENRTSDWAMATAYLSAGKTAEARQVLEKQDLSQFGAHIVRASAYFATHGNEAAASWLAHAEKLGICPVDVWFERGWRAELIGDFSSALAHYEQSTINDMNCLVHGHADAFYRLGLIWQSKMEPPNPELALAYYQQAAEAGDFADIVTYVDNYYQMGVHLYNLGPQYDAQVIEALETALAASPNHSWGNLILGRAIYRKDHDFEQAREHLLRALSAGGETNWRFPFGLGELYEAEGQLTEAQDYYRQALNLSPGNPQISDRLAQFAKNP